MAKEKLTLGQKAADKIALWAGSWTFILLFAAFMGAWVLTNMYFLFVCWDPYPFILLNLLLSTLAAVQAPIILMAQNRQAERDRQKAERDYSVNRKAEREVEDMQEDLEEIKRLMRDLLKKI